MLRSNSKQANKNIRRYILDHVNTDGYVMCVPKPAGVDGKFLDSQFKEVARFIMTIFEREKVFADTSKMGYHNLFVEWCQGLAYALDTADWYYDHSAVDILGDILEETLEERKHFTEQQAEEAITNLVYRELCKAVLTKGA